MSNKVIIVPKSQGAMKALNFGDIINDDVVEYVLDEEVFEILWYSDFFYSLNCIAQVNIDIYEDEDIVDSEILQKVIDSSIFKMQLKDEKKLFVLEDIKALFCKALEYNTGIFFYFL